MSIATTYLEHRFIESNTVGTAPSSSIFRWISNASNCTPAWWVPRRPPKNWHWHNIFRGIVDIVSRIVDVATQARPWRSQQRASLMQLRRNKRKRFLETLRCALS
jgi:hypothetical protein